MNRYRRVQGILSGLAIIVALLAAALTAHTRAKQTQTSTTHTQVVLLGTGNPAPDPDRSGPATAIVVNDTAYLVDFGPGVVRRAAAAAVDKGSLMWSAT